MKNPYLTSYLMMINWTLSPKVTNRTRLSTLATSINIVLEVLARAIREEKEIKTSRLEREK